MALPGKYLVKLRAGDQAETKPLEVRLDPRVVADGVSQADLEEQLQLLLQVQATIADARAAVERIGQAREKLSAPGGGQQQALRRLDAAFARLVTAPGPYPQPMLIDQLASIARMAGSADQKVGRSAFEYLEELRGELEEIKRQIRE